MIRGAAVLTILAAALTTIVTGSLAAGPEALQSGTPRTSPVGTTVAAVTFQDISRQAGIDVTHINGASADKHFEETMGSGGVFLDADQDGWLDIFLVDGGSKADPAVDRTHRRRTQ